MDSTTLPELLPQPQGGTVPTMTLKFTAATPTKKG